MIELILGAVGFLIPLVTGGISTVIVGGLKKFSATIDNSPAWIKQLANVAVAVVVVIAANMLGVEIVGDPYKWETHVPRETVQALIAALVAHVLHAGRKRDKVKVAEKLDTNTVYTETANPFRLP